MMGDLVNDRADIGLGSIHVTGDRQIDVDFTVPFYEFQGWTVMMKREAAQRNPFYFFWIVQWPIWKMLAYAYVMALFILYIGDPDDRDEDGWIYAEIMEDPSECGWIPASHVAATASAVARPHHNGESEDSDSTDDSEWI